jgi:hypothetical protein
LFGRILLQKFHPKVYLHTVGRRAVCDAIPILFGGLSILMMMN